jgi:hypothetical protein
MNVITYTFTFKVGKVVMGGTICASCVEVKRTKENT